MRWTVLVAVLALAAGLLVGALVLPPLLPPSAEPVEGPRAVPVTERAFDGAHTVAAAPELSDEVTVALSGPGGMVTASGCEPGAEVSTGDHLLSVDGAVRIAVVTGVPLWRDLGPGSKGTDVEALQRALADEGHRLEASGTYGRDTTRAVRAMQEAASVEKTGRIALDRVQWVPAGSGAVTSCEAPVGTAIAAGEPLLAAGGSLVALSFPADAKALPGRPYAAVAGDVVVPIPGDRRITDPGLMAAVAGSTAFGEWKREPGRGVAVEVRLAEPVTTLGVPPAAVIVTDAATGCVAAAGDEVVAVEILASELGTVFVVPERPVDEVVVPVAEVVPACT